MALTTEGEAVEIFESGRVLVLGHQPDLVSAQPLAAHELMVVGDRRQRIGEQYTALEVVDVVVERRSQVHHAGHEARVLVAHLDAQPLRALQHVLDTQIVERTTRPAELLAARHGARLGDKAVERDALLAEARRFHALVVGVRAVQTAIDLGQLVGEVADLEVAPHRVILAVVELDEELARGGCTLFDRTVVAERGIEAIRVDAAEQRLGRLVDEILEQILDRALARVGVRGELPVLTESVEPALHEEGEPAVG